MNEGQTKWDNRILACFPEGARKRVKEICDKEDLYLYFCSPEMKSRVSGLYYGCNSIYIDIDLDRFSFFEVFVHELAHHQVFKKYCMEPNNRKTEPRPHGREFKKMFKSLFEPYLTEEIFPPDLIEGYKVWMKQGGVGWDSYPKRIINKYCVSRKLQNLPDDTHFRSRGHGYIKGRYDEASGKYLCLGNYGWFLFDPNKTVKVI